MELFVRAEVGFIWIKKDAFPYVKGFTLLILNHT